MSSASVVFQPTNRFRECHRNRERVTLDRPYDRKPNGGTFEFLSRHQSVAPEDNILTSHAP